MDNHYTGQDEIIKMILYLRAGERLKRGFWAKFTTDPLYSEIIKTAKNEGVLTAWVYSGLYGYSNRSRIEADMFEIPNTHITLCIELIDSKSKLEDFYKKHRDFFKDRTIFFNRMEEMNNDIFN